MVHGYSLHSTGGRYSTLRSMLCGVILHHGFRLDGSVLLRLCVPLFGIFDPHRYMCRDHRPIQLLSTLWRKLSLVVAFFLLCRVYWTLRIFLLFRLLQTAGGKSIGNIRALLWIHGLGFVWVVLTYRICGCKHMSLVQ